MAIILEFRASRDEMAPRPRRSRSRSAEIVIFPGVRYERWRESDSKTDPAKVMAVRDVLKIAD